MEPGELETLRDRAHLMTALERVVQAPREFFDLVVDAEDPTSARALIQEHYGFDERQSTFVLDVQVRSLTRRQRDSTARSAADTRAELDAVT